MALFNDSKREINAKIVYIGQKGAGKATALRYIYSKLKPDCRSELKSMSVGDHQMLFFDFSYPAGFKAENYSVRFHLYTIIAGEGSAPPWKMLLKGVDGVVLLADSTDGKMYANLESSALLMDAIAHYGRSLTDTPISLQCNKRDMPGALSLGKIGAELFPETGIEAVPVIATTGDGLLEGLNRLLQGVMANLGQDFPAESICDVPAKKVSTDEAVGSDPEEAFDHCSDDNPGFSVEVAGEPVPLDRSTIMIPLRLTGGACGKSADIKVTVSVSI